MTLKLSHHALAGLKAGDEILEINNRAAGTLNSSMLKDFLSQPSLGLLVRTYPEPEEGVELLENPPHRVDGSVDIGESPLAFLTSNPGMLWPGLRFTRPCLGGAHSAHLRAHSCKPRKVLVSEAGSWPCVSCWHFKGREKVFLSWNDCFATGLLVPLRKALFLLLIVILERGECWPPFHGCG